MADITHGGSGTIKIPGHQEYQIAIRCLICGKGVITSDLYRYPIICDDCKKAVELVKTLYKDKPCWDCKDFKSGYKKESDIAKEIFVKLIEVSKNFDGNIPLGVLKAWAIEYGVDINDIK